VSAAGDGLDRIYQHCEAYSGRGNLLDYVQHHTVKAAAAYVNTLGRSVAQVHQEAQLHDAIQAFVDDVKAKPCDRAYNDDLDEA